MATLFKASNQPPHTFISGSAIGYYGDSAEAQNEQSPASAAANFASTLCADWEQTALAAQDKTRVVLLRTGIVLSLRGGALKKMLMPFKLHLGGKLSSGQQFFSWIHTDDAIGAIHHVLTQTACTGTFNLTAPEPVTNADFNQSLSTQLGTTAFFSVPAFVLKLLMGDSSSLLLGSQRILPQALEQQGYAFKFKHLNDALDNLLSAD